MTNSRICLIASILFLFLAGTAGADQNDSRLDEPFSGGALVYAR